jgi:urease accessory protein
MITDTTTVTRMTTATTIHTESATAADSARSTKTTPAAASGDALPAASLLQLIWLASPALPVGGFSYSEGLEGAVEAGIVTDEASASTWLATQLHLAQSRSDMAVVADAITCWRRDDTARLRTLNDWIVQTRETAELRQQSEQMGRSMLEWLRNHDGIAPARIEACAALQPTYPIAYALALSATNASARDGLMAFAFGWSENMVQSAIKSVPLGQSAGQRILARLAREIPAAVDHAFALSPDERQAFTPMLAILSSRHETQYSRLFRS